jgi:hypothetical protein
MNAKFVCVAATDGMNIDVMPYDSLNRALALVCSVVELGRLAACIW